MAVKADGGEVQEGGLAAVAGVSAPPRPAIQVVDPSIRAVAFVPIWRRPWMSISATTYGGSLLRRLGVGLVSSETESAYPTLELDDVARSAPDLVLVPSEPYEFSDVHIDELAAALPAATVRRVDGQDLFWWGIRTPAALDRLAAALA